MDEIKLDFEEQKPKNKLEQIFEEMFRNHLEKAAETTVLDFSNSEFIEEIIFLTYLPKLSYFEKLREVNLENCEIGDKLISALCNLELNLQIEILNLSKTHISDHALFQISVSSNFRKLSRLELRECRKITDSGILDILRSLIIKVEYVDLSETNVSDLTLDEIAQGLENGFLQNLKEVFLYFCPHVIQEKTNSINQNFEIFCYF